MLPVHRFLRAICLALVCSSAALSCAPTKPATKPVRQAAPVEDRLPAPPAAPAPGVTVPGTPIVGAPLEETPLPATPAVTAPPVGTPGGAPPIVALLPLDSPDFKPAAEAVQRGMFAAAEKDARKLPIQIRRTDASAERILAEYAAATSAGPRVIVGPMTRSGVSAVAMSGERLAVPTLALNTPEGTGSTPAGLYAFGLSLDIETRMLAAQAFNDGMRNATVVNVPTALARRSRDAFVAEWRALGGKVVNTIEVQPGVDLVQLRQAIGGGSDAIFLAAGLDQARLLRPYLPPQLPVYATSQINTGVPDPVSNVDLNGVRFVDMPWLLQSEGPIVSTYARPDGLSGDLVRFYALGIDAYRIAAELAANRRAFELDGVTGRITLQPNGVVERRPLAAVFRDGAGVARE